MFEHAHPFEVLVAAGFYFSLLIFFLWGIAFAGAYVLEVLLTAVRKAPFRLNWWQYALTVYGIGLVVALLCTSWVSELIWSPQPFVWSLPIFFVALRFRSERIARVRGVRND